MSSPASILLFLTKGAGCCTRRIPHGTWLAQVVRPFRVPKAKLRTPDTPSPISALCLDTYHVTERLQEAAPSPKISQQHLISNNTSTIRYVMMAIDAIALESSVCAASGMVVYRRRPICRRCHSPKNLSGRGRHHRALFDSPEQSLRNNPTGVI